jgi:hypothetical protein
VIKLTWTIPTCIEDAHRLVQMAIDVEFGTLPPYLYAMMSIPEGENTVAFARIKSVAMQEMVHMCLACNILNAIGGSPKINPPTYPGPLPGDIGDLIIHLYPFSENAMKQAMDIEQPEEPIKFPVLKMVRGTGSLTIGEFYDALDSYLKTLPDDVWQENHHQINDSQFFQGQLFAINNYDDAHRAIDIIVSEGEGAPDSPLDFQNHLAHYYRFKEVYKNKVLVKDNNPKGYAWGEDLGVDWNAVYPAIDDPQNHDFSKNSIAAQQVQEACNTAYTNMVDELTIAFNSSQGHLGNAVQAMFDLRMAGLKAFQTPLNDQTEIVAGPSFLYSPEVQQGSLS